MPVRRIPPRARTTTEAPAPPEALERYRPALEEELRRLLPESAPRGLPLYTMLSYHLGWVDAQGRPTSASSGKALRPALCLLACEGVGGDWRRAVPAAAALELVHNFSLIHDDIQDGDRQRRHRPTVWALWGRGQGINAGDAMRELAGLALLREEALGVEPRRLLRATALLDQATLEMIEGQYLDLSYESCPQVTVDDYLAMIAKKTGALMRCALELGAILGGAAPARVAHLAQAGLELGLVFQIRDDILGVWGRSEVTGKPQAGDIRRRKRALPAVHALEHSRGQDARRLHELYNKQRRVTANEAAWVLKVMEKGGSQAYCQRLAEEHYKQALGHLGACALEGNASDFEALASFLLTREA
ncbi:MAG: polyprenyl synthetase family protein [Dehalococcoidia bacterium]|nr:polyprenyl synthetase family protein [Dehalococcoidia bacterium]